MSDLPTASRVADPGVRALYALENRWQAWLDVEAALAVAQAELGIIPAAAAEAIVGKARLALMDRGRIDAGFARTGHTLVPLVWELGRIVGEVHGGWVHWGATTQNITQTGDLLVLRQAHGIFRRQIGAVLAAMAELAERGAEMPIAGRTHGQHAVPATFGFKVAVWIDELIRHAERLEQAAPRLFVAMLGGAAGTYASLGEHGPAVQAGVAKHLGMGDMAVPARSIGDHLAENICPPCPAAPALPPRRTRSSSAYRSPARFSPRSPPIAPAGRYFRRGDRRSSAPAPPCRPCRAVSRHPPAPPAPAPPARHRSPQPPPASPQTTAVPPVSTAPHGGSARRSTPPP